LKITELTCYSARGLLYVKLDTDEGISGFGECSPMQIETTLQLLRNVVKPQVLGMSPFDGERMEERVLTKHYKLSGQLLAMAYSGVEIACWDIRAKAARQPLYNLLGGAYRSTVPLYGSSMSRDLPPEEEAAKLREMLDRFRFPAVKIKVGPRMGSGMPVRLEEDVAKVRAVREAIGPDVKLMVDGNSSYSYAQAVQLHDKIKEYDIHHYEEPCPYYDVETYVKLAAALPVPIHVGEQDWNIFTFRDFIARGACHMYAADPIKCGGLSNAKRAAALCRAFGVQYVPHNTTRGIGFAAALHLAASTPECSGFYEYSIEKDNLREQFLRAPFEPIDGRIAVPTGEGLGIEIDVEKMEALLLVTR